MTESKRQRQTAEIIRRHFGVVLQQEGSYIYGQAFVTVTKVYVTPDISQAKIYLSVYNVEDKQVIIDKISAHSHHLKKNLAYRIKKHVRRIPEIAFYNDETLDEMYKVNSLLDEVLKNDANIREQE
ncbi:MAG: 30S ribosome-binding factor RbfA [Saprospiraceae bacterium]|nr:30S ribosome-binding factor RbfA [Bacteroidia bacterium]NNE16315.1 30S ribosome-binding factor RbfA [Saprospiraceae bacterium]NNL91373.1 30S ribosome-binding factor RbfA [Saprospiraceae bacterium]